MSERNATANRGFLGGVTAPILAVLGRSEEVRTNTNSTCIVSWTPN